jgi:hypothetical protein
MSINRLISEMLASPLRVTIGVQDHTGRWHKCVFRDLRDPQFAR